MPGVAGVRRGAPEGMQALLGARAASGSAAASSGPLGWFSKALGAAGGSRARYEPVTSPR